MSNSHVVDCIFSVNIKQIICEPIQKLSSLGNDSNLCKNNKKLKLPKMIISSWQLTKHGISSNWILILSMVWISCKEEYRLIATLDRCVCVSEFRVSQLYPERTHQEGWRLGRTLVLQECGLLLARPALASEQQWTWKDKCHHDCFKTLLYWFMGNLLLLVAKKRKTVCLLG